MGKVNLETFMNYFAIPDASGRENTYFTFKRWLVRLHLNVNVYGNMNVSRHA